MRFLNTIVLLVLVLGLGGFLWWDGRRSEEGQKKEEREARLFPGAKAEDLRSLRVTSAAGKGEEESAPPPLVVIREKGRWFLGEQKKWLASASEMDRLARDLAEMKRQSVIAEELGDNRSRYGLDQPARVIELEFGGDSPAKHRLELGDRTPDEAGFYAVVDGAPPIVKIPSYFASPLEKKADELREKRPLPVPPGEVTRVRLASSGVTLEMEERDEEWRLLQPLQGRADGRKVRDYLWKWEGLKIGRFLKPEEEVSFENPRLRLEVWQKDSDRPQVLEVGFPVPAKPKVFYARRLDPEERFVVELGEEKEDLLQRTAADFEDRHLVAFQVEKVKRLEARIGGQELEARRIKGGWEIRRPREVVKEADQRNRAIDDLLWDLRELEWTERAAGEEGLASPRAQVTLYGEEDRSLGTVRIGKPGDQGIAASRAGDGEVVLLEKDPVEKWSGYLDRLTGQDEETTESPEDPGDESG